MNKSAFEKISPIAQSIEESEIFEPNMPVEIFLLEAENLNVTASADRKELTGAGLSDEILSSLKDRIDALTYAQSLWEDQRNVREEAQQKWIEALPALQELKDRLEHSFRFAFRRRTDLLARLRRSEEGNGYADLLQDLSDLAVTGKNNKQLLKAINFDMKLIDEAEEKSSTMKTLLATANGEADQDNVQKIDRDRLYTYLKYAVDEIRATGKYVFWRKDRASRYASEYFREQRRRREAAL